MKRRAVIYTQQAGAELDWIYAVVSDASSATIANRYDQRLRAFCQRLDHASER